MKKNKKYELPNSEIQFLSEPVGSFYNASSSMYLGNYSSFYNLTTFEKIKCIEKGIKKIDLENFKLKAKLDYDNLAKAIGVTRATLINNKTDYYNESISERILALIDLYSYGYQVFENELKFNSWMFTQNKSLGNIVPFDLVNNQFGREEIKNLLGRIEHGIYS